MPQSLSLVIVHFVGSTKERYPFINEESRKALHGYLATLCQDLGCHCFEIDGTRDHVHIATTLPRTLSQADLVEDPKKKSSKWFKAEGRSPMVQKFAWQRGYAAFSVSQSRLQSVVRYVQRQEVHPRTYQLPRWVQKAAHPPWRGVRRALHVGLARFESRLQR